MYRNLTAILVGGAVVTMLSVCMACATAEEETAAPPAESESTTAAETAAAAEALTTTLTPDSDRAAIVAHLLEAEGKKINTEAMAVNFPDLDRQTAYDIQADIQAEKLKTEERVGWKIGFSRMPEDPATLDPIYGHIMASNVFEPGTPVEAASFVADSAVVEGEFAFWIGADLPGPDLTREQVGNAVSAVGGVIELLSSWTSGSEENPSTRDHDVTGNVFHVGIILGETRVPLAEMDFTKETATVEIDGEERASALATMNMGVDPLEALTWLANELTTYSEEYLRAGDVVITGTVFPPPRAGAGSKAVMSYTTLGTIEVELK